MKIDFCAKQLQRYHDLKQPLDLRTWTDAALRADRIQEKGIIV